jgi:hypothetical protein
MSPPVLVYLFNMRTLLLLCVLSSISLFSQPVKWEKVYGSREYEYGRSIQQTIDGGYIVAGSTSGYGAAMDMYLMQLNNDGTFRWHKWYGGGNDEWAYSVKQTPVDSGFIICGFSNTWGGNGYDVYLVKTDKLGNVIWENTYGGPDWDFGYSVDLTSDGGYVVAGSTYSYGAGGEDAFMVKVDAAGSLQWFNVYGGFADDNATEIHQTSDGGYVMSGKTKSFSYGDYDAWVIKTTFTGDTTWTRHFGTAAEDGFNSIIEASDGRFIAGGYTWGINGSADFLRMGLTSAGTVQDSVCDTISGRDDVINNISENIDGTFFTVGYTDLHGTNKKDFSFFNWYSNLYYLTGSTRGADYDEIAYQGQQTVDKGWVMVGYTESWGNGKSDLYIVKLDSDFQYTNNAVVGIKPGPVYNDLSFFPNPASSEVNIAMEGTFSGFVTLTIHDILGREVMKMEVKPVTQFSHTQFTVPVTQLPEGTYSLSLSDGTLFYSGNFLVKH